MLALVPNLLCVVLGAVAAVRFERRRVARLTDRVARATLRQRYGWWRERRRAGWRV